MKKFLIFLLALLMVASCFALTGCNKGSNLEGHTFTARSGNSEWNSTCPEGNGAHGWLGGKCIYCGAVLSSADSDNFWDKVGQGAMTLGTMLAVTAIASLAYWLACMFGWGWLAWVGHILMLIMGIGSFITFHWVWGIVFFVVFGGAYLGLICPLITQHYYDYNGIIH